MNVSHEADRAFIEALKVEDPSRHSRLLKNMRRDSPSLGMDESRALTNFMLGLPTGGYRFEVVAGTPIDPVRVGEMESSKCVRRGGRPRLHISSAARTARRRKQWRESQREARLGTGTAQVG